ncbi:MAG: TVP38/TMEM64 family protein [Verrucomicrobia bacterium]|nr:TVP38/TMEM64 family protein [Verrucomicrobiota bacterium]
MDSPADSRPRAGAVWKWLAGAVVLLALLSALRGLPIQSWLQAALDWVGRLGAWGPVIFIGIYIVASICFLPASVLTLGAGALFGVVRGSVCVSVGATLGATAAFLIGRHLARDAVARRIGQDPRFAAMDQAVAREGWKIVGLTRLSPVFPFNVLNYAFGLTRVPLGHYVLASWIGMMPGTILYVYLGSLAKVAAGSRTRTTGEWVLYGLGLLATVLVTVVVTRLARQSLARRVSVREPA